MPETSLIPSKFDRRVVGDPIQIDGRSVLPVARVHGYQGANDSSAGAIGGGKVFVDPVEVIVREADGAEFTIALPDPTAVALRSMAGVAAALAVVAMVVNIVVRLLRRR